MWHDVRFAVRLFRRTPAFAATAMLTLALGIGLTTAVFSVVDGVLFRALPYNEPDRLYVLFGAQRNTAEPQPTRAVSLPELRDWQRSQSFERLAAFETAQGSQTQIRGIGEPIQVTTASVSAEFLDVLGVAPALGRPFIREEYGSSIPSVALISDSMWRRAFGADPSALGQTMIRGDHTLTIVGILPRRFVFPTAMRRFQPDVLVPGVGGPQLSSSRNFRFLTVIGRLSPERSVEDARAEMDRIALQIAPLYVPGKAVGDTAFDGVTIRPLNDYLTAGSRNVLRLVFAAVVMLFALACVNVAGLLFARRADRERELAIRTAMGAGRYQIARQLVIESALLAAVSGVAGWFIAFATFHVVTSRIPAWLQLVGEPELNARAVSLTMAGAAIAVVACGVLPLFAWSLRSGERTLRAASRTFSPPRRGRGLIGLEVALSTVLLAAGAILLNSWMRLQSEDPGVDAGRVMVIRSVPSGPFNASVRIRYTQRVADVLRSVPAVESVSFTDVPVLSKAMRGSPFIPPFQAAGATGARIDTDMLISPGYFETMGIPIMQGRTLTEADRGRAVVISDTLSRRYWPDRSPVGEIIRYGDEMRQIVGVAGDVRDYSLDRPAMSTLYHVWNDTMGLTATMMVRFSGPREAIAEQARAALRRVDDGAIITVSGTYQDLLGRSVAERRFNTTLFGLFACAGLLIALVGVYGMVAVHVAQRAREMGIRSALGATPRRLKTSVVASALVPVLIGLLTGICCALLSSRYLRPFVYAIEPTDASTLVLVAVTFIALACTASYLPARRAASVDPLAALRAE